MSSKIRYNVTNCLQAVLISILSFISAFFISCSYLGDSLAYTSQSTQWSYLLVSSFISSTLLELALYYTLRKQDDEVTKNKYLYSIVVRLLEFVVLMVVLACFHFPFYLLSMVLLLPILFTFLGFLSIAIE